MRRRSTAFSIARARRNAFVSRALESRLAAPPSRPMTCFQSRLTSDSWVMEPWNHKAIQPVNLYFSAYGFTSGGRAIGIAWKAIGWFATADRDRGLLPIEGCLTRRTKHARVVQMDERPATNRKACRF